MQQWREVVFFFSFFYSIEHLRTKRGGVYAVGTSLEYEIADIFLLSVVEQAWLLLSSMCLFAFETDTRYVALASVITPFKEAFILNSKHGLQVEMKSILATWKV